MSIEPEKELLSALQDVERAIRICNLAMEAGEASVLGFDSNPIDDAVSCLEAGRNRLREALGFVPAMDLPVGASSRA